MKISKKKCSQLYDLLHNDIMTARIKIAQIPTNISGQEIAKQTDNILSDLCMKAPQKAIEIFTPTQ